MRIARFFMVDDDGGIVARQAVGVALGIGRRPEDCGERILLTKHRPLKKSGSASAAMKRLRAEKLRE